MHEAQNSSFPLETHCSATGYWPSALNSTRHYTWSLTGKPYKATPDEKMPNLTEKKQGSTTWAIPGPCIKQYRINCPEIICSTKHFALIEFFILSHSTLIQRNCFKWNVKSSSNSVVSICCSGNYHLIIHVLWPTNILHYPSYLPCP